MSTWVGLLRGINLGKRRMKMAELRAVCDDLGFTGTKTILASGNVRFETTDDAALQQRFEDAIEAAFNFRVRVLLRRAEEITSMIASEPFAGVDPTADVACHVVLADAPLNPTPDLSALPAHVEVTRMEAREIFLAAHRLPNGRYTEGLEVLDTLLPKGALVTMRNWNTMLKLLV